MKKKINDNIKLSLLWVFSFIIIILIMSFRVNAESPQVYDGSLPYKYEYIDDLNTWARYNDLGDTLLSSIESYGLPINDDDYVLILTDFGFYADEQHGSTTYHIYRAWFSLYPIEEFTTSTSNIFQNQATYNVISSKTAYHFGVHFDVYGGFAPIVFNVNNNPTISATLFGHQSGSATIIPNSDPFVVTSNVPFYFSKSFFYNSSLVLEYEPISPINVGVAIIPPEALTPDYPTGTTPPTQVPPVYTSTDYTWTTPPTFDGSTVENAIGSLQNLVGWLANNLKEEFKNLTSNLKGFFEYIGKTIQYYGNAILETLNNFIQNFYDNMKSLFEPMFDTLQDIKDKIVEFADLFIHPFDKEEFEKQINSCQLITQYNELLDNCEVLQQIFDETSEPDSFILYIDFENPFADSEHKIIHGEINFNWLVPLRPVYRPFLQVFVLIECFVGGFRILGNIIGGKAK